jgi:hypothetical protein
MARNMIEGNTPLGRRSEYLGDRRLGVGEPAFPRSCDTARRGFGTMLP